MRAIIWWFIIAFALVDIGFFVYGQIVWHPHYAWPPIAGTLGLVYATLRLSFYYRDKR